MIDTHVHLYDKVYDTDGGGLAAIHRARQAGVTAVMLPNVDRASIEPIKQLAAASGGCALMAMGLHPTEMGDDWKETLQLMSAELESGNYHAIGECGIDLYWDKENIDLQMQVFDYQLAEAGRLNLPVLIHCREGFGPALEVLQGHKDVKAVFHCFTGTLDDIRMARKVLDPYFGIGGVVTFKNSDLRSLLPEIGIDRILTETDAPYLAPVPYRGKRNESAYIPLIVDEIAKNLNLTPQEVDELTTRNAVEFIPAFAPYASK